MSGEEYRNTVSACRNKVKEPKAYLILSLVRGIKVNRKGFCRYIICKRKTRENVESLLNSSGDLVTKDSEEAHLLHFLVLH